MQLFTKSVILSIAALALFNPLPAELVFEKTELDIEAGLLDDKVEAVFPFTNKGDAPLTILDLRSSCGCTVPQLDKRQYGPGESGEIRAVFNFGSRVGLQRKRVTVTTNDPSNPVYQLVFSTEIPQWAEVEPKIIRWEMGPDPEPKTVRLRILHPDRISVVDENASPANFSMQSRQLGEGVWEYSLEPLSASSRLTERIYFTLAAETENGVRETRQVAFHCLVR